MYRGHDGRDVLFDDCPSGKVQMRCLHIEVGMHNYLLTYVYLLTYTNTYAKNASTCVMYLLQTKQKIGRDSYTYLLMHDSM